jgi:hypothetical protein
MASGGSNASGGSSSVDGDPCANAPMNGAFCGSNLSSFAEPESLYTCDAQQAVAIEVCEAGCNATLLREGDRCAPVEQG